jgi:DNA-binding XRE family transcriptional regulator
MKRVGKTSSGNIIIEMTPTEWLRTSKEVSAMESLPSLIKQYREENKASQDALGRKAGISRNTIREVERGKLVNLKTVEKILSMNYPAASSGVSGGIPFFKRPKGREIQPREIKGEKSHSQS